MHLLLSYLTSSLGGRLTELYGSPESYLTKALELWEEQPKALEAFKLKLRAELLAPRSLTKHEENQ